MTRRPHLAAAACAALGCHLEVVLPLGLDGGSPDAGALGPDCADAPAVLRWLAQRAVTDERATQCFDARPAVTSCAMLLTLPAEVDAAAWCQGARGVRREGDSPSECLLPLAQVGDDDAPRAGEHGVFFARTGRDDCPWRLALVDGAVPAGSVATLSCLVSTPSTAPADACRADPVGSACEVETSSQCLWPGRGCASQARIVFREGASRCASGLCARYEYTSALGVRFASPGHCTCRCAVPADLASTEPTGCACPAGYECVGDVARDGFDRMRGGYCVRRAP